MRTGRRALLTLLPAVVLPPLVGALLLPDFPWRFFLELPPRTHYIVHAGHSRAATVVFALLGSAALLVCLLCCGRPRRPPAAAKTPHWFWFGVLMLASGWGTAWARGGALEWIQPFSFTLIWLGYTITAEALLRRRAVRSLKLSLFPLSAGFWWSFELLNRFVQNWSYPALERFSGVEYVILASLAFSTVLPAMNVTFHLLAVSLHERFWGSIPLTTRGAKVALFSGILTLALVPIFPNALFAMLWGAPLLVAFAIAKLYGLDLPRSGGVRLLLSGRQICAISRWALAGLICGGFWELWNFHSAFKWLYHIPYVQQWHVFEMPLLGFAGYLPFGVLCGIVIEWEISDASAR